MTAFLAWCCAALGCAGLCVALSNLAEFAALRPARGRPRSIVACIAMRDEGADARGCIESLLAQPEIAAVFVADDGSSDATPAIAASVAAADARVRVLRAPPNGRPKVGALAAAVELALLLPHRHLLFTDADMRFAPGALGGALAMLRLRRAQALSAWPRVAATSLWDRLFGHFVIGLLLHALPMRAARGTDPRFAAANGQLLLVERTAYERAGGHAAIDALVEDVALAHALKRSGARIVLCSAARVAATRGYGSLRANVRGYGRSLFFGAGFGGCVAFGAWQAAAFVLPWLLVGRATLPALVGIAAALASRALLANRTGESLLTALLAPVEGVCGTAGGFAAAALGMAGGYRWRGRRLAAGRR